MIGGDLWVNWKGESEERREIRVEKEALRGKETIRVSPPTYLRRWSPGRGSMRPP
jgi:hypothetical protein